MIERNQPPVMLLKHALSSYVLGWYMLWACMLIGASDIIRPRVLLKYSARIGFYYVLLAVVAYPVALSSDAPSLFMLSPVGRLLPRDLPSTNYSFGIFVYIWEDLFARKLPRLSLFFPWSTVAGYAGLFLVFMMMQERDGQRRHLAVGAGVFMLVASMSRLAWIAFLGSVALYLYLGFALRTRIVWLSSFGSLAIVLFLAGAPLKEAAESVRDDFDAARAGASQAREAVYVATWRGIEQSPWLGYGWPGESTLPADESSVFGVDAATMVIGSHSTISGLIYKGGFVTFALFVTAMSSTVLLIGLGAPHRDTARGALAMLLGIGLMCAGEGLESLAVPNMFAFIWIGLAVSRCSGWLQRQNGAGNVGRKPQNQTAVTCSKSR